MKVWSELPELVRGLLEKRGITEASADIFLNPDWERDVHDPFLLKDMDKATARILRAVDAGERITIFSDFDADGIPGAVLLSDFFKKIGHEQVSVRIPHRNTEGFGLNARAIDACSADGTKLLITVDCGSADVTHTARAQEHGIDVIITDHHQAHGTPPPAYAMVNPNQEGDTYPNKYLCGAGVAFKVVQALIATRPDMVPTGWEKWLLDMVGIATLSDMVPLQGENRALAHYGLIVLRKSPRIGLRTLLRRQRVRQHALSEDDVVFSITPRINAASRMDAPEIAFELLTTHDEVRAEALARQLDTLNNERKGAVAQMSKEIHGKIGDTHEGGVVVVGNTHWRPGLLGLAATRAVEVYGKPAFVWGRGDAEVIKGSVRGDGHTDIVALMQEVADLFLEFGGHTHSGGFSITVENLIKLPDALNRAYEKCAQHATVRADVASDATLPLTDVHPVFFQNISVLAPFGMGNEKPIFVFENNTLARVEWFGKEKNHLKLILHGDGSARATAIRFFAKGNTELESLVEGQIVTVHGSLEREQFGGANSIRIRIIEIARSM